MVPLPETSTATGAALTGRRPPWARRWHASIRPTSQAGTPRAASSASAGFTVRRRNHRDHPQPHVEGGVHLRVGHAAEPLQPVEDRRPGPPPRLEHRARPVRQAAGQVARDSAARDVGEALHLHRLQQRQHVLHVDARRLEQHLGHRPAAEPRTAACRAPPARPRASGATRLSTRWSAAPVRPGRRAHLPGGCSRPSRMLRALHHADAEARQVVLASRVEARHAPRSRRRAARTPPARSPRRCPSPPARPASTSSRAGREVVEEEQRLGAAGERRR